MFYVLAMLMTINGQTQSYGIDSFNSKGECVTAMKNAVSTRLYTGPGSKVSVQFQCKKTHLLRVLGR